MFTYLFFTFFCFTSGVLSSAPCKNKEICLKKFTTILMPQVFSGTSDVKLESYDPLLLEKIVGDLSILKYTFVNNTLIGYKKCLVSNMDLDEELTKMAFDINCPEFQISGSYDMKGRIVVLPVEGNGDYSMETGKYYVHVESELKTFKGKDEKDHVMIKNFKLKCKPLEPLHFDFKNLFNGQKDLSDAVHKFAHENWQEVADLVQDPIIYAVMKKTIANSNKYLKHVPLEEILQS